MKKQLLLLLVLISSQAFAINKCDELAADPQNKDNPQRVIGVEWENLQAEPAIKACLQAITDEPNNARYQYQLGSAYFKNKDYTNAIKWYKKSAKQNYVRAFVNLGYMYEHAYGVEKNLEMAAKWYQKAAKLGDVVAQYNVGVAYYNGFGIQQNYQMAIKWYTKAAEQNYNIAQYNLGYMYYAGEGVKQDLEQAVKLWIEAAKQGNTDAQQALKSLGITY